MKWWQLGSLPAHSTTFLSFVDSVSLSRLLNDQTSFWFCSLWTSYSVHIKHTCCDHKDTKVTHQSLILAASFWEFESHLMIGHGLTASLFYERSSTRDRGHDGSVASIVQQHNCNHCYLDMKSLSKRSLGKHKEDACNLCAQNRLSSVSQNPTGSSHSMVE